MLCYKFARAKGQQICMILSLVLEVLSLVAAQWALDYDKTATFFLTPFRAWELLIGSVLALGLVRTPETWATNTALATLGLGMVFISVAFYVNTTLFPGVTALLPYIGTALVIISGNQAGGVVRILTTRPFVFSLRNLRSKRCN